MDLENLLKLKDFQLEGQYEEKERESAQEHIDKILMMMELLEVEPSKSEMKLFYHLFTRKEASTLELIRHFKDVYFSNLPKVNGGLII